MGSAASANEAVTKSTRPTKATQPAAVPESKAAKRKSTRSAGSKRPAAKRGTKSEAEPSDGPKGTAKHAAVKEDTSPADVSASRAPSGNAATRRKPAMRVKTRYAVGQQIVYPLQGVGRIERLEEREFQGSPTLYYVVYLEVSDMTIMIPVDKADSLGIRAIVSKRKAERALRLIAEDFDPIPTDWKLRYQMNLDLLKQGAVDDIASVVRALSYRSRIKELPILERKLYDSALRLMVDEVSYSLGKDKTEIENLIEERLKNVKQKGDE